MNASKNYNLYGHHNQCIANSGKVTDAVEVPGTSPGLATASSDRTIRLWSPHHHALGRAGSDGFVRPVRTLKGHSEAVNCLAMANTSAGDSGSAVLVSGGGDRTLRVWSLAPLLPCSARVHSQQQQLAVMRGHGGSIQSVLSLHDGAGSAADCTTTSSAAGGLAAGQAAASAASCMASGGLDSKVKIWDLGAASCTATFKLPAPCMQLLSGLALAPTCWAVMARQVALIDVRQVIPVSQIASLLQYVLLACCLFA